MELTPNFTFFSTIAADSFREKLDYIFSDQIPPYHCKNETFYIFSDHLALYVHFKPTSSSHTTNNIWKLNNSILKDQNLKLKLENSNTTEFQSWDELKYFWRNILIQFKKPNANPINKMTRLSRDIDHLSNILKKFPNADDIRKVISSKQEQSKLLAEENSEYWRIRSKARWIEEGEISSKYFFSRFKIRNNDSYIQHKKQHDNCSLQDAMNSALLFYQDLYKKPTLASNINNQFLNHLPKVSQKNNNLLIKKIFLKELQDLIISLSNNKSPSSNSLIYKFYKTYFNYLGSLMIK